LAGAVRHANNTLWVRGQALPSASLALPAPPKRAAHGPAVPASTSSGSYASSESTSTTSSGAPSETVSTALAAARMSSTATAGADADAGVQPAQGASSKDLRYWSV